MTKRKKQFLPKTRHRWWKGLAWQPRYESAHEKFLQAYKGRLGLVYLGEGRHRVTYQTRWGWVLKFPKSREGLRANRTELKFYKKHVTRVRAGKSNPKVHWQLARCEIWAPFSRVPVLKMEWVKELEYIAKKHPKWIRDVDCSQVGYNVKGKLVAFDYADELVAFSV